MRLPRPFVALTVVLALCSVGAPSLAQSSADRLDEIEDQIAEKRARIDAAEDEAASILDQIADSDSRLRRLNATLGELRSLLAEAQGRLAPVQAAFAGAVARHRSLVAQQKRTEKELAAKIEILGERAANAYRFGPGSYFDIVFTSSSFGDLIARQELASRVLLFDSTLVDEVEATKARLSDQRIAARAARLEIQVRRDELKDEVEGIAKLVEEQAALQAALEQEIALREDALDDVEAAKESYEAAVADLQAESDRIRGIVQGGGSSGGGSSGGTFYWPTAGSITSGFGWRTHPIFGTQRFHAGVDMGGACGQPIYAADSGTVLANYWSDGYGLFTILDHGDGLSTAYAHQSSANVSSGQSVSRGQAIGAVGTTGWSTGCHLHFEVRVNGTPVDPVPYLT
jgi:murein DD-endopeptidase MepM/ murein hydrolase activator NlpD